MRWGYFILALLIVFLFQTAVQPLLGLEFLDLLLVLALICGLAAPAPDARLAGWLAGFAQDLGTNSPMGLHAFMLGLAILALTYLREWVNQSLWWVRWLIMFVVAFPAQLLLHLHLRYLQGGHLTWPRMIVESLFTATVAALVTVIILSLPAIVGRRRRRRYAAPRW